MAAWVWILIAIGVVVVLAALVLGVVRGRTKKLEERREKTRALRQEADTRERAAHEHEQHAREARKVAAEVGARADELDPDRETPEEAE
jgi:type II secretory pathway pseudopilin PulG